MKRREFLTTSSLAGGAVLSSWAGGEALAQEASSREFYELRTYEMQTGNRKAVLNDYLEKAFIPALNRLGSRPVGVFTVVSGSNALNLFVLVPHASLESFLAAPASWRLTRSIRRPPRLTCQPPSTTRPTPATSRRSSGPSRTCRRCGCPRRRPATSRASSNCASTRATARRRRSRRSRCSTRAARSRIFDKVGLRSVFFGQTLVGRRQPNLVYMTVHQDMVAREKTWEDFRNSPDWKALSSNPVFANTVSATTVIFLRPAAYSQI